jgi:uncharacterized protein (DUF427 family)
MDVVKHPGPDHPITLTEGQARAEARFGGQVIAASDHVIWVKEGGYHAVAYFPRADVEMGLLKRTDHDTYCPYKGHASYFSLEAGGTTAENAVWSYETPHPGMEALRDRLAFYSNIVEVREAASA